MLSIMTVLIAGVGVMTAPFIPFQYQILDPLVQVPLLCVAIPHILYVFILNRESPRPSHASSLAFRRTAR